MSSILVVGAGRGLGRGVAVALADSGSSKVISVSRSVPPPHPGIAFEIADAADEATPARLLDSYDPSAVVLVAGAIPDLRPLPEHTWQSFSANWQSDVRITFHWLREILLRPLRPGSRVIVFSSGAALAGSPLSGGYAGAKATQRLMTAYAQDEADRAGLKLSFTALLPKLTPLTDLGRPAAEAYATRSGQSALPGPFLTPAQTGAAVADLLSRDNVALAYALTADGLREL